MTNTLAQCKYYYRGLCTTRPRKAFDEKVICIEIVNLDPRTGCTKDCDLKVPCL